VTLADALKLLAEHGTTARPIAGGTDLVLQIARGAVTGIDILVDLSRVPELGQIERVGDVLRIGALVTHGEIVSSDEVVRHALALAQASAEVGAPALRNRATVVGNIVTASPANDTISALWALDATVVIVSLGGERRVRLREFFPGIRRTLLELGELVTAIEIPPGTPPSRSLFVKLGQRRAQAISVVHLAVSLQFDGPIVTAASIALGSVAATVVSATAAETLLTGQPLSATAIAEAARIAAASVHPISDIRGSADYRSHAVSVLLTRALHSLADGTERSSWVSPAIRLRPAASLGASAEPTVERRVQLATQPVAGVIRQPIADVIGEPITGVLSQQIAALSIDDATVVCCQINGKLVSAPRAATATLLDWLRDEHHLTGTKEGCAEGECGACTVHIDGAAALSCLVPAARAAGAEITTIEGLGHPDPTPLQQAFIDQFAVQCGYCIPGFIMAADRLLAEQSAPSRTEIASGLSGNLCRCTGYYRFYEAVEQAAQRPPMSAPPTPSLADPRGQGDAERGADPSRKRGDGLDAVPKPSNDEDEAIGTGHHALDMTPPVSS
jgi:xanthine dehydrogenase iron-sulfur cluster and FAD-binding subunit A